MLANDNFDTEASVLSSAKKDAKGNPLSKNRLKELRQDDTRSMVSMQSNISSFSRKSGVSLINMESILSLGGASGVSKRLPGATGLKENAERRMQKAQMARIDA